MENAKSPVESVIAVLAAARSMELFAIYQYMSQHYALDDWGYGGLASLTRLIAIDEMRHAEELAERIVSIVGAPRSEVAGSVQRGQDLRHIFPFDVLTESETLERYNAFLITCRECGDSVSACLFERLIEKEQQHHDDFKDVANHIATLGDAYLACVAGCGRTFRGSD